MMRFLLLSPKRYLPLLALTIIILSLWHFDNSMQKATLEHFSTFVGELKSKSATRLALAATHLKFQSQNPSARNISVVNFEPSIPKPFGSSYTKAIIIGHTRNEQVSWASEHFGNKTDYSLFLYTADDPTAPLHPPLNKGHEVMIYLTYIIDHYHNLSDINIFMHAHQHSWHNNELLGQDAQQMISRLSAEWVWREGYVNMRCQWDPGCPDWIHPDAVEYDPGKKEETSFAKSWIEMFPLDRVPRVLAQPCCGQFAVSRERILALPLEEYVFLRDWLLRTNLPDELSGRVWEYVWQFLFTGKAVHCPKEHICNCVVFGVCFGGERAYNEYYVKRRERDRLQDELKIWTETNQEAQKMEREGRAGWEDIIEKQELGKDRVLQDSIRELNEWCSKKEEEARQRGDTAVNRARKMKRS